MNWVSRKSGGRRKRRSIRRRSKASRRRSRVSRRRSRCNSRRLRKSCNRRSRGKKRCSWVKRKSSGKRKHRGYCKKVGGSDLGPPLRSKIILPRDFENRYAGSFFNVMRKKKKSITLFQWKKAEIRIVFDGTCFVEYKNSGGNEPECNISTIDGSSWIDIMGACKCDLDKLNFESNDETLEVTMTDKKTKEPLTIKFLNQGDYDNFNSVVYAGIG